MLEWKFRLVILLALAGVIAAGLGNFAAWCISTSAGKRSRTS